MNVASPPEPARDADAPDDARMLELLRGARRIAIVGASDNPARPSFLVANYLARRGYEVIAVNPGLAGRTVFGSAAVARLADIEGPIDIVDIFRNAEAAGPIVDEALALPAPPGAIWMQLGVRHPAAAAKARGRGVTVVMNRCPKIEIGRLSGEIGSQGINSRILSSKRPRLGATVQARDLPGGRR